MGEILVDYFEALTAAMAWLGQQSDTVFLGQGVGVPGTTMSDTFKGVSAAKRIEMPVAEDLQVGMALGMSLTGWLPVCVFPRWNFLICATNQLVNHLDRMSLYSDGGYMPRALIRVATPSSNPFNPGPQHDDDFAEAFHRMFRTIDIWGMIEPESIMECYQRAYQSPRSAILVEYTDRYRNARGR